MRAITQNPFLTINPKLKEFITHSPLENQREKKNEKKSRAHNSKNFETKGRQRQNVNK